MEFLFVIVECSTFRLESSTSSNPFWIGVLRHPERQIRRSSRSWSQSMLLTDYLKKLDPFINLPIKYFQSSKGLAFLSSVYNSCNVDLMASWKTRSTSGPPCLALVSTYPSNFSFEMKLRILRSGT